MNIDEKLDQLTPKQMSYVIYRTLESKNAPAYRKAGYSKDAWYRLPQEHRDLMNECASILSRETKLKAIEIMQTETLEAAKRIIELAKTAKNEHVRLKANSEILALSGIVPKKEIDITVGGEGLVVTYVNKYPEEGEDA